MPKLKVLLASSAAFLLVSGFQLPADDGNETRFIEFKEIDDPICIERWGEGKRVHVFNNHPERAIDLKIDRYFREVRQPGRSMFPLPANGSQSMGCNRVFDEDQRWELIEATFITDEQITERYGSVNR